MLHLVRHGSAGDRLAWRGDQSLRPLDAKGQAQAEAIGAALAEAPVRRVLSSPSLRCVQTVEPLAKLHGVHVELVRELAEGAAGQDAEALIEQSAASDGDIVLSSHGDLIPYLLRWLSAAGLDIDPVRCKKASVWHLQTVDGLICGASYSPPPKL